MVLTTRWPDGGVTMVPSAIEGLTEILSHSEDSLGQQALCSPIARRRALAVERVALVSRLAEVTREILHEGKKRKNDPALPVKLGSVELRNTILYPGGELVDILSIRPNPEAAIRLDKRGFIYVDPIWARKRQATRAYISLEELILRALGMVLDVNLRLAASGHTIADEQLLTRMSNPSIESGHPKTTEPPKFIFEASLQRPTAWSS